MDFKEYLKMEIEKPVPEYYSQDGNSCRAVVVRGFYREVVWQYKKYPTRLLGVLKDFDGLETPIGWFIQLPIMIALSPVVPVITANYRYKTSINEYKVQHSLIKQDA